MAKKQIKKDRLEKVNGGKSIFLGPIISQNYYSDIYKKVNKKIEAATICCQNCIATKDLIYIYCVDSKTVTLKCRRCNQESEYKIDRLVFSEK